jgi:four helix bundle protein
MNNKEFKGSRVQSSRVESFEDLNVYKQARALTNEVYNITRQGDFSKDYGLMDQIRRASVSIMSNIAEGFERGTNAEFIQFLFYAKGSCGEVRAQLSIAFDQKYIEENIYNNLVERCRRISGMLSNLITYLKGARYQGTKYKKPQPKNMAEEMNKLLQQIRGKEENP